MITIQTSIWSLCDHKLRSRMLHNLHHWTKNNQLNLRKPKVREQACLKVAKRNEDGPRETRLKKMAMRIKTERVQKVLLRRINSNLCRQSLQMQVQRH